MTLKKIIGTGAIAGALGFSALGLAGVANAAPAPQPTPGVAQHAQLADWHGGGGGWHGDGDRGGWHGDRGRDWGGHGGWGGGRQGWCPLGPFGLCID